MKNQPSAPAPPAKSRDGLVETLAERSQSPGTILRPSGCLVTSTWGSPLTSNVNVNSVPKFEIALLGGRGNGVRDAVVLAAEYRVRGALKA